MASLTGESKAPTLIASSHLCIASPISEAFSKGTQAEHYNKDQMQKIVERHQQRAWISAVPVRPCNWKGTQFDSLENWILPPNKVPITSWKSIGKDEPYESNLTPQPRQNQIFEAGYAFGMYPKRTILVQFGRIRPFSDISGRYIANFTATLADRNSLKNSLENAGCALSDKGDRWLSAGDFSKALS